MGMSIDELYQVIDARKRSGKHYMFMETSVYGREFLYVKNLYEKGELGRIQFMRCAHYQDMEGWPDYWLGFPPLMHPTHAVAPCLEGNTAVFYCLFLHTYFPIGWVAT